MSSSQEREDDRKLNTPEKVELFIRDEQTISSLSALSSNDSIKQTRTAFVVAIISYIIGLGSIAAALFVDNADRKQQRDIQQINLKIERIKQAKQLKIAKEKAFNDAATDLRGVRELEIAACQYGLRKTPEEKFKFQVMRHRSRTNLAKTIYGMQYVFDDLPNIKDAAEKLIKYDEGVADVCSGPSEGQWKILQVQVAKKIEGSIKQTDELLKTFAERLGNNYTNEGSEGEKISGTGLDKTQMPQK